MRGHISTAEKKKGESGFHPPIKMVGEAIMARVKGERGRDKRALEAYRLPSDEKCWGASSSPENNYLSVSVEEGEKE